MSYTLAEVESVYKKLRSTLFTELILLISALVLVFIYRPLIIVVLGIAVILHMFIARPTQKKFEKIFDETNIALTTMKKLGADNILPDGGIRITEETIRRAYLMPCDTEKGGLLLRWEMSAEVKKMRVSLCDAVIPEFFQLKSKGKRRVFFNSGVWTHVDLPVDTGLDFRLLDITSVPTPVRMSFFENKFDYETVPLDDETLKERCVLYHHKGNDVTQYSRMMRHFKDLLEYTTGYPAMSVRGSRVDIFIRARFLARPITLKEKPTQAMLDFDPFPELGRVIDLAHSTMP